MLLNEPHVTVGHCISVCMWLKQPCASFLEGWNKAQILDAVLLSCIIPPL